MNRIPITAVARRELEETGTDWRILIPLLVLSLVVPLCILVVILLLVRVTDQNATPDSLVPLALLLCGFLPAGFSLVNASESFVGERERSTLESLLATPMTDRELYTGKLLAALTVPICGSFIAMTTFTTLFMLQAPTGSADQLPVRMIALIAVLVTCKALVMVTGAIVVSIHATTIRAANLLASFLLVPMGLIVQVEALLLSTQHTNVLLTIVLVLVLVASFLIRTGLSSFNREGVLARDHHGLSLRRTLWSFKQFLRGYHPAGVQPDRYAARFSLRQFYRQDVACLVREYRRMLVSTAAFTLASIVIGAFAVRHQFSMFSFDVSTGVPRSSAGFTQSLVLLGDMLRLSFGSNMLGGLSFGILALVGLATFAAQLGYELSWYALYPQPGITGHVVAQWVLWLPGFFVAVAFGLRVGIAPLFTPRGFSVGQHILWSLANFLKMYLLVLVPWFILAALIEGWLFPLIF
ncbi:MAG: hypothetical protein AVDCRST_MAG93-9506 [uncultured Chloroflexia bacterium]|uniref:ABC-2 type transporter domain-containing protein n=1 Tax=uncultured Chloroflexia bacterium TaxID=1672391 RepID=A0A6J4NG82_9CHLR|nr:MAG: hypothetical protein AVDCRST_MAG93-9506 [uncultured Chloroflexia bacterium]